MDAIECMKTRRSIRAFRPDPVRKEIIEDIIDCGRLAASAINIQPWHFVVVTDEQKRQKLADTTDHGKFIAQSPVCVVVLCDEVKYYLEDGSAATQNILNAAKAHGLASCWVAGDKKEYAQAIVKLVEAPENLKLVSLVAIGYADEDTNPPKKALQQVIHWEKF